RDGDEAAAETTGHALRRKRREQRPPRRAHRAGVAALADSARGDHTTHTGSGDRAPSAGRPESPSMHATRPPSVLRRALRGLSCRATLTPADASLSVARRTTGRSEQRRTKARWTGTASKPTFSLKRWRPAALPPSWIELSP